MYTCTNTCIPSNIKMKIESNLLIDCVTFYFNIGKICQIGLQILDISCANEIDWMT